MRSSIAAFALPVLSEDNSFEKNVQQITDKHISIVDEKVSTKEKEIMTI